MPIQFIRDLFSSNDNKEQSSIDELTIRKRFIYDKHHEDTMDLLQSTVIDVIDTASSTAKTITRQLKETETRLFSLLDSMEDVVVIKDANNRWLTANRAAQELFNFHQYEYIGKTNSELVKEYPHLVSIKNFHVENEDEAWEKRVPIRFIDSYITDDDERYFDVIKSPTFYDNGHRKEIVIIARDITQNYLEQQKTKACFVALNASSDAIVILNQEYNIFFSNSKFNNLFDYQDSCETKLVDIIPDFEQKYNMMIDHLRKNLVWRSCWDNYEIVGTPIMNGLPEPIYHIIIFKYGLLCSKISELKCKCAMENYGSGVFLSTLSNENSCDKRGTIRRV